MWKALARSLLLVLGVASVAAWPFTYIGVGFFSGVAFFTVLQFVVFYLYKDYQEKRFLIEQEKLVIAHEAELAKQGAEVACPCDRNIKCLVPIVLGARNEYTCPGCNKNINVMVNFKTALVTTPVTDTPTDTVIKHYAT